MAYLKGESPALNPEEQLLLALAQPGISGESQHKIAGLFPKVKNWEYFLGRCMDTYLAPVVYKNLGLTRLSSQLPTGAIDILRKSGHNITASNVRLLNAYREAADSLKKANIEHIPLKGVLVGEYIYKNIGLRHTSDIDLLVRPISLEPAKEALLKGGWSLLPQNSKSQFISSVAPNPHPYQFAKGGHILEMHVHIHPMPRAYCVDIEEYWGRSSEILVAGIKTRIFNNADLLQHLCLHLDKHLQKGNFKLISFLDIAMLIASETTCPDWNLLATTSIKYGCKPQVGGILWVCKKYFASPVPTQLISGHNGYSDIETKFLARLKGNISYNKTYNNLLVFSELKGIRRKSLFIVHNFFPSEAFMRTRYRPSGNFQLYLCYFKRIWEGLNLLFSHMYGRVRKAVNN